MADLHFIRPALLLLFIPLLVLIYLLHKFAQQQQELPIARHLMPYLTAGGSKDRRFAPHTLLPVILALLIIIISGPTWQPEPDSHAKNQSPLYLVVDLSSSMSESDIAPSRIENSKLKLAELLELKVDGYIGAFVYSGSAHLLIPPTEDRDVVDFYLSALSTGLVPRQGKSVSSALEQIGEMQSSSSIPASILVVTDGLDNSAVQAFEAYQTKHKEQILVWKFGYGDSVAPPRGIRLLQNTPDNSDVLSVIRWVESFRYFDPRDEDIDWQEAGYFLVFPTMLLSLLWFRKGWSIRWAGRLALALLIMPSIAPTPAYASNVTKQEVTICDPLWMRWLMTPDQRGQWFYQREQYACAVQSFVDPEWKIQALMKNNQWEWALTMLNNQPDSLEQRFNVALSYLHIDRFRSAQHWFEQVLEVEPEHPQAKQNLAMLEEIFQLMAERSQGQGTAGEDMTADVISSLEEDMGIEQPEERSDFVNSADLMAEEHLTKIWLEQVKSSPEVFLRNKFTIQLQQSVEGE